MLFAGACALIARQVELGIEYSAGHIAVAPVPVTGSIFTRRQLEFLLQSAITVYSSDLLDPCGRLLGLVLEQAPDYGAAHAPLGLLAETRLFPHEYLRIGSRLWSKSHGRATRSVCGSAMTFRP